MKERVQEEIDFEQLLAPETALEKRLLQQPKFREGLHWGTPRYGHPEGKVGLHIREVLNNIEELSLYEQDREFLRLIAFTHDTFKFEEEKAVHGKRNRHHGVLARHFLHKIYPEHPVLDIIELHDEAYFAWRDIHVFQQVNQGEKRLEQLLHRIKGQRQLFYSFFKCDTQTGDKTQAPIAWFERTVMDIDLLDF